MSIDEMVEPDVKTTPWLLGYICHHWRALSRSLWTNISLMSRRSDLSSSQRNLRKHLLSLSEDLPLRIYIIVALGYLDRFARAMIETLSGKISLPIHTDGLI